MKSEIEDLVGLRKDGASASPLRDASVVQEHTGSYGLSLWTLAMFSRAGLRRE